MARIYDNIENVFKDGLINIFNQPNLKRADFCVGYFNLRGWNVIENQIDNLPGGNVFYQKKHKNERFVCRLLIGMFRTPKEYLRYLYGHYNLEPNADEIIRLKKRVAEDFRKQLLIGRSTKEDELTLKHLLAQLKEKKVVIKLNIKPLHAKLYLVHREDYTNPCIAIMGSSNLTFSGLNLNGELNTELVDIDDTKKLSDWFNDRWYDNSCVDITEELIDVLEHSWAGNELYTPYDIYLKTAYYISEDIRNGINDFEIPKEFKKDLLEFQKPAVQILARRIFDERKRGAMIGDVVGLGKTITACAVIKIIQRELDCSTLIICPANLIKMWEGYVKKYDLNADIKSKDSVFDTENIRKYYKFIVIDESHNLRNPQGKRYKAIKAFIENLESKVLLLTATPYNKDLRDMSAQLKLFVDSDTDLGIRPEKYINHLGGAFEFNQHHDALISSIDAFEKSDYTEDWNDLMSLFLVRRTRTFIKNNYAKLDRSNNRMYLKMPDGSHSYFPTRVPKSVKFPQDTQYKNMYCQDNQDILSKLLLPRYGLTSYLDSSYTPNAASQDIIQNLSRAGRRLIGFTKVTMFKRMESSGYAFLLTLARHIVRNCIFIYAIENKLAIPIGDEMGLGEDFLDDDSQSTDILKISTDLELYKERAKEHYNLIKGKHSIDWLDYKVFVKQLVKDLQKDNESLIKIINKCGEWNPDQDSKLETLYNLVNDTHKNEKVLIFTQYADTANYLKEQLAKKGVTHIDVATGNSEDPTALACKFSPISNEKTIAKENQLRILVATDVLSEGQNLQDGHIIINYDLPWAIIRLIQRAGRVDRIGQTFDTINCYSFFPDENIETIIDLRGRLNRRINENADIVGSDEIFFEGNEQNLRDIYNEKAGILEDEDSNSEVDITSYAYEIWKNAINANPILEKRIANLPSKIYSSKQRAEDDRKGVITYARTSEGFDSLCYYDEEKHLVSQSPKKILDIMACNINEERTEALPNHHEIVEYTIQEIENTMYSSNNVSMGSRLSTRSRLFKLIEDNRANPSANLTQEELRTLDFAQTDIIHSLLRKTTKFELGRMLRTHIDRDRILLAIIQHYRNDTLCIEQDEDSQVESQIICSLGLTD